jgi:hypothetical protein
LVFAFVSTNCVGEIFALVSLFCDFSWIIYMPVSYFYLSHAKLNSVFFYPAPKRAMLMALLIFRLFIHNVRHIQLRELWRRKTTIPLKFCLIFWANCLSQAFALCHEQRCLSLRRTLSWWLKRIFLYFSLLFLRHRIHDFSSSLSAVYIIIIIIIYLLVITKVAKKNAGANEVFSAKAPRMCIFKER